MNHLLILFFSCFQEILWLKERSAGMFASPFPQFSLEVPFAEILRRGIGWMVPMLQRLDDDSVGKPSWMDMAQRLHARRPWFPAKDGQGVGVPRCSAKQRLAKRRPFQTNLAMYCDVRCIHAIIHTVFCTRGLNAASP